MELSSIDIHYLVKELQSLDRSFISTIYQPSHIILGLHKEGKHFLHVRDSSVYVNNQKEKQNAPTPFCMSLRKRLLRAKLIEIEQVNFERIIKLTFSSVDGDLFVYIELFANGNFIVTNDKNIILIVKSSEQFKDRTLKKGETYCLPPEKVNTKTIAFNAFKKIIDSKPRTTILKTLAIEFSLGGKYATELCKRCEIAASIETIDKDKQKELYDGLQTLFVEPFSPNVGLYPNPFILQTDPPIKSFEKYSDAIDYLVTKEAENEKPQTKKEEKILLKQQEHLVEIEQKILTCEAKANLIYQHMHEVQDVIKGINDQGWNYNSKLIKQKHPKKKEVTLSL
tara:strand:+ start:222 stop:1238 length:1017 start_codon:yes stop_codon:yes gene_type:complete